MERVAKGEIIPIRRWFPLFIVYSLGYYVQYRTDFLSIVHNGAVSVVEWPRAHLGLDHQHFVLVALV